MPLVGKDREERAKGLQHVGIGPGVPVAGEEDGLLVSREGIADYRHGRLALLLARHGKMRSRHYAVLELADEQHARLGAGQGHLDDVHRLFAREHHHAVLPALVEYGLRESGVHSREARQFARLVHAGDARRAPVDLLEAREVGILILDARGGAGDVDPAVHALAVHHVVGHYLNLGFRAGARRRGEAGQGGRQENQKQ